MRKVSMILHTKQSCWRRSFNSKQKKRRDQYWDHHIPNYGYAGARSQHFRLVTRHLLGVKSFDRVARGNLRHIACLIISSNFILLFYLRRSWMIMFQRLRLYLKTPVKRKISCRSLLSKATPWIPYTLVLVSAPWIENDPLFPLAMTKVIPKFWNKANALPAYRMKMGWSSSNAET